MEPANNGRERLVRIASSIPSLTINGLGSTREQQGEQFEQDRAALLNPDKQTVDAFLIAEKWIGRRLKPTARLSRRLGTSYGIKHQMQRELGAYYVSNGTFIVAMVACGYRWKRAAANSPNAIFNASAGIYVGT